MGMAQDNLERQNDEIEALSAIYGSQWCVLDTGSRQYSIEITNDDSVTPCKLTLQVQLPIDYPQKSPPTHQISAPWLRGQERINLCNSLEEIYIENTGESVLYQWIEKCREFLLQMSEENISTEVLPVEEVLKNAWSETDGDGDTTESVEGERDQETSVSEMAEGEGETCPAIAHGGLVHDRKSVFQAHVAPVHSARQVQLVMEQLLENRKIAAATHNIQAYRISQEKNGHNIFLNGCVDDGEIHAGSRMLHLLEIVDAINVLVVVTRWYGGVHLGPDRFKHINNCTRQILLENGYIKDKEDKKKGPKSRKKGK